jgi:hypothetical protein
VAFRAIAVLPRPSGTAMSRHKYAVGERVEFSPARFDGNVTRGVYTITRQLPSETLDLQYRVKNSRDSHERVVSESQLRKS